MLKATYIINSEYEDVVANALPDGKGVLASLTKDANKIAALAKSNISQAPNTSPNSQKNVAAVKDQMAIKSAREYFRKQNFPGTKIPVVLVVSNAWQSKWYEFGRGSGNTFPAMHFLKLAGAAVGSRKSAFKGRGRSKGGNK